MPTPSAAAAVLLALGCSALWGVANVYVQRAGRAVGALRAMFWAQSVGAVGLFAIAGLVAALTGVAPVAPGLSDLAITAAGSAVGYYGMLLAFESGTLTGVVPLVTAWSVPAAFVGVVWSGDRPTGAQWLGSALIVLGALGNGVLASRPEPNAAPAPVTPRSALLWAAVGAVGFGVMAAGTARMRESLGPVAVIPTIWSAQWVLLYPVLLFRPDVRTPPPRAAWPAVLGMGLFEASGFLAFTLASRLAPVAVVSPPASLSSLLTVLYGWLMLGESLGWARWAFVLLAVVGMVVSGS